MKKNLLSKNIHQWLLLLVCFVGTLPSWAEDYPKDGIIYDINTSTNTATVKGLEDKSATSAKIRNRVAGCEVTSIGNGAFFNCSSLTSINIPSSVTSIGGSAFSGCSSLTAFTVDANNPNYCAEGCILFNKEKTTLICASGSQRTYDIPSSVTSIGGYAFSGCSSLTSINIPNSVTSIGRAAFYGCSSLTSINIPNYVTSIEGFAFNDCSSLTSINIPSSVTSIEEGAFSLCKSLETVSLPNSLESIYPLAFQNSNISSISIPAGVKGIGENAFYGCENLSTITVSNGNTKYDSRDNCNALIETATNTILRGSSNTVIPNSVTAIGRNAFRGSNIAKIVIPASVKNIGQWAFQDCKSLTTVVCKSKSVIDVSGLLPFDPLPNATLYVPAESIEVYKAANEWSKFSNIQPLPYADITITAAGKTTYCSSYALDFTNVEGVKAYLALGFSPSTGVVFLTRVNKIPAGVGFMIFGKEGQYEVPFCETDITYANLMVGTKSETTVASTADGKTNYVLANGVDGVMFYLANDAVVPANKAYLSIPSSVINTPAKVIRLGFEDDITTGILRVEDMTNKTDNKVYGLDGRRKASLSSGFNIVNGKKIYVK